MITPAMPEERRRSIRLDARLTTIFKVLSTGKARRALTKNMSGVGLCIVVEGSLETGTKLGLEIQLPNRQIPIVCTGEVVWARLLNEPRKSYQDPLMEVGVKFNQIDPKDQASIKQFTSLYAFPSASV